MTTPAPQPESALVLDGEAANSDAEKCRRCDDAGVFCAYCGEIETCDMKRGFHYFEGALCRCVTEEK